MPALGGTPSQLTFQSGSEIPCCFSPDGESVYFTASNGFDKEYGQFPFPNMQQLYRVPAKGGRIERIISLPVNNVSVNKPTICFSIMIIKVTKMHGENITPHLSPETSGSTTRKNGRHASYLPLKEKT